MACCNYRVSSRSRPPEFEIEMEIHMTWETSGVDLDRVWTGADNKFTLVDFDINIIKI